MREAAETLRERNNKSGNSERVNRYRNSMGNMGMVQINYLVPENRAVELKFESERMRAEYFVELCELEPSDERRQILAIRNAARIPTYSDIGTLQEQAKSLPLAGELKKLTEHVTATMRAQGAMQTVNKEGGDDAELIKWASLIVAHSHAAKYYASYIKWRIANNA